MISGGALVDLFRSERGLICVFALVCATVMFGQGHLTAEQWQDYTWKLVLVYVGGKTVTSAIETVTRGRLGTLGEGQPPVPSKNEAPDPQTDVGAKGR